MKGIFKFLFLLLWINYSFGQSNDNEILIQNLIKFRKEEIGNESKDNLEFRNVLEYWNELEPNTDKLGFFIFNCQYSTLIKDNKFSYTKEIAQVKTDSSKLSQAFKESELNILIKKVVFLLLIQNEVFDYRHPYKLLDNRIFEEIKFYNLDKTDTVCEIGAGQGIFSLLLHFSNPAQKIYVNDFDQALVNFVNKYVSVFAINRNNFIPVKGGKTKTNLPEKVDKIILRNTFHHFSKKNKMMKSIKSSLNSDGEVIIMETLVNDEEFDCKKRMTESGIKNYLKSFGFLLFDERKFENNIYLKYKISNL